MTQFIEFKTPFNHDTDAESAKFVLDQTGQVSLAVQEAKDDADINVLMARFGLTGVMPVNHRMPEYGDFSGISDYRTALEAIATADEHFMAMPADVRSRFENNPQRFLEFCADRNNLEEARKLGLAIPVVVEDTKPVDVVK